MRLFILSFLAFTSAIALADIGGACRGERSCISLDGDDRKFCDAYKGGRSCFMAFDGDDRGWCEVIKERRSCFMSLNGTARARCEQGRFPGRHVYWADCADISLPDTGNGGGSDRTRACRGETTCFSLDGDERKLCEAYKGGSSCFIALNGDHRGWCEVLKEGKSCFMALNGTAREQCERGRYPGEHIFWRNCGRR